MPSCLRHRRNVFVCVRGTRLLCKKFQQKKKIFIASWSSRMNKCSVWGSCTPTEHTHTHPAPWCDGAMTSVMMIQPRLLSLPPSHPEIVLPKHHHAESYRSPVLLYQEPTVFTIQLGSDVLMSSGEVHTRKTLVKLIVSLRRSYQENTAVQLIVLLTLEVTLPSQCNNNQ